MFLPFHPCFNFNHPKNRRFCTRQAALDLTKRLLLTRLLRPNSSAQASRRTKWWKNMRCMRLMIDWWLIDDWRMDDGWMMDGWWMTDEACVLDDDSSDLFRFPIHVFLECPGTGIVFGAGSRRQIPYMAQLGVLRLRSSPWSHIFHPLISVRNLLTNRWCLGRLRPQWYQVDPLWSPCPRTKP